MPQQDEFEQYKVPAEGAGDEFAQYKVPSAATQRATAATPPPPGFLQRLGEGTGVPTTKEGLQAAQPSFLEGVGGPAVTAAKTAYNLGKGFFQSGMQATKEIGEAQENIDKGQPLRPNLAKAGYAATTGLLESNPITKPISTFGQDIQSGNYSGAAGDAVATAVNYFLSKRGPSTANRINKLASATGPAGGETVAAYKAVLPELDKTAKVIGEPNTIGELETLVKKTQAAKTATYNGALYRNAHQVVETTPIADKLKAKALEMPPTEEGQAAAKQYMSAADEYKGKLYKLGDLDRVRRFKNAKTKPFYAKSGSAQMGAMLTHTDMAIDKIIGDNAKDMVYEELGKYDKTQDWAKLKNQQHHLMNLQDQLQEQVGNLTDKQASEMGKSFWEKEQVSASAHPGGVTPRFHGLMKLLPGHGPLDLADTKVSAAFPSQHAAAARKAVLALPLTELNRKPAVPAPPQASTEDEGP